VSTAEAARAAELDLRVFLDAHAKRRTSGRELAAAELDMVVPHDVPGTDEASELERARSWQRSLFDAGLAWLDGPVAFGGRGLDPQAAAAVRSIMDDYEIPSLSLVTVSHNIVAPVIAKHGTLPQQQRWLSALWRSDAIACQLFSEPEAGSDLASLRTSAVRDGDDWVVTGQKVWSSGAHYSQVGELLARTGTPADRHRGITAFLLDMSSPGIEIRRIQQMNGGRHFNEVFLDHVRVPDADRLGPVNGGWAIAMSTLGVERAGMTTRGSAGGYVNHPFLRFTAAARELGLVTDPAVQELLAETWIREQLAAVLAERVAAGGPQAPAPSVGKLATVSDLKFYAAAASRLLGDRMIANTGEPGMYAWAHFLLTSPAQRIAGGADQIQRNIIAERVLGLPRDPLPPGSGTQSSPGPATTEGESTTR
jgi:alkylation response protein AidB-like acyl-CoA dehydrogenase